jgi:hypothetical protein
MFPETLVASDELGQLKAREGFISLLSFLKEKKYANDITILCVSKLLNHLVDFYSIQKGGHDIEGDLNAII